MIIKSKRMQVLEHQRGKPIELIVAEAIQSHATLEEAAKSLGIVQPNLWRWMRRLGLEARYERGVVVVKVEPEPELAGEGVGS